MRVLVVICAVLLLGAVAAAMKSDTIDIDVTTIKASNERHRREAQDSGDDDDDGSTVTQADEASGSAEGPTTAIPKKSVIVTKKSKEKHTKPTPKNTPKATKHSEKSKIKETKPTEKVVQVKRDEDVTTKASEKVLPTTEENMLGGGVSEDGDMAARKGQDQAVQVLTTEVIAAVVVGGVCAIILIAFLVYRLRKRDEGSYILTDNGFKDTNKLRGDTGKEAFV